MLRAGEPILKTFWLWVCVKKNAQENQFFFQKKNNFNTQGTMATWKKHLV